jgi:parallel beta-helix repeat protein
VSLVVKSRVAWRDVEVRRLDPRSPWGVIVLQDRGASGSILDDCDFEGGSHDTIDHVYYSGMLSVHCADRVQVRRSRFAANVLGDDTIRFARCADLLLDEIRVEAANGDAIDCDISTGLIRATRIIRPHNDGVDLMTASVDLTDLEVEGAGDKGISLGESSNPTVRASRLTGCNIGVALKDGSNPVLEQVEILDCQVAVDGYDKNWRYPGGGRGLLRQCTLEGNGIDVRLRGDSTLILESTSTEERFVLPQGEEQRLTIVPPDAETGP